MYKGEGEAQVCDRIRTEITKHYRRKKLSGNERRDILNMFGARCANCWTELADGEWEVDHKTPLSAGGTQ